MVQARKGGNQPPWAIEILIREGLDGLGFTKVHNFVKYVNYLIVILVLNYIILIVMIKIRSRFLPLKPSTLPSWGRFSINWQYISSWACHSYLIWSLLQRDSWAIISTASLHVSKEVPLPPYFSIVFVTLRPMFNLVGGRVEEGSFCY